jgi:hypothetical protein
VVCVHYRISDGPAQEPAGRRRRCLLKGCECWFRPVCPQSRFCSAACRVEAERWRRWRGSQRYRASEGGKAHRREQARRYRQRGRRTGVPPPEKSEPPGFGGAGSVAKAAESREVTVGSGSDAGLAESAATTSAERVVVGATSREGQRPAEFFGGVETRPCDRPGCYCRLVVKRCAPGQRFCCLACRRALRRVLDREARWRERRRRRWRQQHWGAARPP